MYGSNRLRVARVWTPRGRCLHSGATAAPRVSSRTARAGARLPPRMSGAAPTQGRAAALPHAVSWRPMHVGARARVQACDRTRVNVRGRHQSRHVWALSCACALSLARVPSARGTRSRRSRDRFLWDNGRRALRFMGWAPAGRRARTLLRVVPGPPPSSRASGDTPLPAGPRPSRRLSSGPSRRWSRPRKGTGSGQSQGDH